MKSQPCKCGRCTYCLCEVQPAPKPGTGDMWRLVIADMEARRLLGIQRYGTPLQPGNGRDVLIDAYHEALDLAVYLRTAIEERGQ